MNNFYVVRLLASIMVLFSHSFYLYSIKSIDPLHRISGGIFTFGNIGVYIFLIVSGYLVTQSFQNSTFILNFLWKRALRILPGLWFMVLLSVLIIGPILSNQQLLTYFTTGSNFGFLTNIFLFIPNNFKIPSIFNENPIGTFNGCLWTIAYEVFFYLLLSTFFFFNPLKIRFLILAQWLAFIFIQYYLGERIYTYSYSSPWLLNLNLEVCFRFFIYFESGVIIYLFKEYINRTSTFIIYMLASILIIFLLGKTSMTLELILPYFIIFLCVSTNKFSFIEKYGDFSYGLYLYGYIAQQYIVSLKLKFMNEYWLFILSLILTLLLAIFSWFFIEKKAIKYKNIFVK